MNFIDDVGLTHFHNKLKETFVSKVNGIGPENGNIDLEYISSAGNLTSPDKYNLNDRFIYRTTAKDKSVLSGEAKLLSIQGNTEIITIDGQKVINVATPSSFASVSLNQYNNSKISNTTIDLNNTIQEVSGKTTYYCRAAGNVLNGYVAYNHQGLIQKIGWCATVPQIGSTIITTNAIVTSTLASIQFEEDGYVVVVLNDSEEDIELCIHPQWSGYMNETYEPYILDTIILPTQDTSNNSLPLASYGMPAIGNVRDEINFETQKYIKRIGQYAYSIDNLNEVIALSVPYDYDNTNIFYVLNTPVVYDINVNDTYIMHDFGTELFNNTNVSVIVNISYDQNLRDRLRMDIEPKKYMFNDITVSSNFFNETELGTDFPYTAIIPCQGIDDTMIPEVFFNMQQAISGVFAPVAETVFNGIKIYASEIPETDFIIPTIICWQKTN